MNKLTKITIKMLLSPSLNSTKRVCFHFHDVSLRQRSCRLLRNLSTHCCNIFSRNIIVCNVLDFSPNLNTMLTTFRKLSTNRNLYDVLGITPTATQKEVKAAYFKLSKVYHPDVTDSSQESTARFRAISEAYQVLGNSESRKVYDSRCLGRGFGPDVIAPEFRMRRPPTTGRTSAYNYDEWTRYHYSDIFERQNRELRRRQWRAESQNYEYDMGVRLRPIKFLFFLSNLLILFVVLDLTLAYYADTPKPSSEPPKPNGSKPK